MLVHSTRPHGYKLHSSKRSGHPQARHSAHSPVVKRHRPFKMWLEEDLKFAYRAVSEGMPVRRAAQEFGVPKSTLHDRVSGRVEFGARSGPPRYLSDKEEEELTKFLVGCAKIGYARSKKQVLAMVTAMMAKKRGKSPDEISVTTGWWASFQRRHPELTLRTASKLAYCRSIASNPEVMQNYFDLLEATLKRNKIFNQPTHLFNCDESGFSMEHKPGKLIGLKRERGLNVITSGNKCQLTVLACVSAAGYAIPPMIIFDRQRLQQEFTVGEIPGTLYGLSRKGWIDTELFGEWFNDHFLLHSPVVRPIVLFLDGHSSHYQPAVVRKAAANKVILFCLPPHTTHLAQPLDRSCFSPLKAAWNVECQLFNPGKVVNRYNFVQLFSRAWARAMNPDNIKSGFRVTGIYPFDRNVIKLPVLDATKRKESPEPDLAAESGLAFVPLFSPAPSRKQKSMQFTQEEEELFQRRFENGYDLKHDERYNQWISLNHSPNYSASYSDTTEIALCYPSESEHSSESEHPSESYHSAESDFDLAEFFTLPVPKEATVKKQGHARVLTSRANLEAIELKEKEKQEKEDLKRQKKEKKELKRVEREKQKKEKEVKKKEREAAKLKQKRPVTRKSTQQRRPAIYHSSGADSGSNYSEESELDNYGEQAEKQRASTNQRRGRRAIRQDRGGAQSGEKSKRLVNSDATSTEKQPSESASTCLRGARQAVQDSAGAGSARKQPPFTRLRRARQAIHQDNGGEKGGQEGNVSTKKQPPKRASTCQRDPVARREIQSGEENDEEGNVVPVASARKQPPFTRQSRARQAIHQDNGGEKGGQEDNVSTKKQPLQRASTCQRDPVARRTIQSGEENEEEGNVVPVASARKQPPFTRQSRARQAIHQDNGGRENEEENIVPAKRQPPKSASTHERRARQAIHQKAESDTLCFLKECNHPAAWKWIKCSWCGGWFHQVCEGVPSKRAEDNTFVFICSSC